MYYRSSKNNWVPALALAPYSNKILYWSSLIQDENLRFSLEDPSAFTNREYSLLFTREAWKNLNIWGVLSNASGTGTVSAISHDQHWCVLSRKPHPYFTPRHSWPPSRYSKSMQFAGSGVSLAVHTISRTRPPKWYNQLQGVVLRVPRVHNLSTKDHFLR